ncbi:nuclear transport factor 2 family protein [Pseudoalteromonas ardens]|uniref:Nuclear transport factor 2 family protein n=1 Tax=Pseudoalteromonas rubra TaxID=43658 RepID=A0A0L0ENX0_9GAMM|nr:nuclear transport factor 2 family protein [Pseudoalteromonas sp. R96]KNC66060.1 hypothetical protein AC626_19330 [Pseudoalteromonas rubra]MDK1313018.1 nuclear transport factor 2 family protein [Pseudoalteromonas sp. R96]
MVTFIRLILIWCVLLPAHSYANLTLDRHAIEQVAKSYLIAQIEVRPKLMAKIADDELVKRTYWQGKTDGEFVMSMDKAGLVKLAAEYNVSGDRFAKQPKMEVNVLDLDERIASVKLTTDEWVDYMHLYKNASGEWQILNVLWQFHQVARHRSGG